MYSKQLSHSAITKGPTYSTCYISPIVMDLTYNLLHTYSVLYNVQTLLSYCTNRTQPAEFFFTSMGALNIRSVLKGHPTSIKFGSDTSLVPVIYPLSPQSEFAYFSRDTVPLNTSTHKPSQVHSFDPNWKIQQRAFNS